MRSFAFKAFCLISLLVVESAPLSPPGEPTKNPGYGGYNGAHTEHPHPYGSGYDGYHHDEPSHDGYGHTFMEYIFGSPSYNEAPAPGWPVDSTSQSGHHGGDGYDYNTSHDTQPKNPKKSPKNKKSKNQRSAFAPSQYHSFDQAKNAHKTEYELKQENEQRAEEAAKYHLQGFFHH